MREKVRLRVKRAANLLKRRKLRLELWWIDKKMAYQKWQLRRLERAKEVQESREFVSDNE